MIAPATSALFQRLNGLAPRVALVLGSGLGSLVDAVEDAVRIPYADLPGFPHSGVSGHAGEIVAGYLSGKPVLMLAGRAHYYEQGNASVMRPVIAALADLGVEILILTNAAGSVRHDLAPGSLMLIDDHINFSGLNPLIGEPSDQRFVGMTTAYDRQLREAFLLAAGEVDEKLEQGVYMWFSGPSFETPAEIRMARTMGADAVGMSTVPEVILARFFGLRVVACSVVTNYGAGMTGAELSHEETKDVAPKGGVRLQKIIRVLIGEIG
ncbi:purine-nucleoside phosphorylase [Phyllobacterium trifolii]|jgi:purine-nucleoside phosphorylase|uniref:Purine nucleoside phosphorylase n=1 Tax=Phyllobacterium trifolii TaxID=300193 RepID=A0A839U766_9HYPH|nr:purine-nucleoside phosphorylase [Phyllobacterium trifolii]MBB3144581.1 purine-nucleoside phosphorylase [Phyllobacterium trifolii]